MDDLFDFDSINQIDHIFNCNDKIKQDFDVLNEPTPPENNISNDILWEYIDDPSPNNDVSKLFNNNGIKPKADKNKRKPATGIKDGMLTKEIKQISKISPAAKYLISCYFKHKCLVFDDVIIPECVEILTIIYLAHPAFIHIYLGDENAQPLQQSHKLFVIFGYHTLDILIDEFFKSQTVISAVRLEKKKKETKHYQTDHDSILNELFNVKIDEKERRIWRRDIKMPIPPYNGSYREIFDHIDELFFEYKYDAVPNNIVQYNDWDDFLGIDESKKHKKSIDDEWVIVVDSIDILFETKNGLSEVEILIEQKDVLSDWVRDYKPPHEPWLDSLLNLPFQYKRKPKDIANKKILNLKDYK